ncbi:hypothetical protein ES708_27072 [subsurface metagenome]
MFKLTTLKIINGKFNRVTDARGIKVFSDLRKGVDFDLRESRPAMGLVDVPQLTITSFEQAISCGIGVTEIGDQGGQSVIEV